MTEEEILKEKENIGRCFCDRRPTGELYITHDGCAKGYKAKCTSNSASWCECVKKK